MHRKDTITMTPLEIQRYQIVETIRKKELTQREGAEIINLSVRQIQRLVKKVEKKGPAGVMHGLRGEPSRHKIKETIRKKVIRIYRSRYEGFGPTLAAEKLEQRDGIKVSRETLRQWLLQEGLWEKRVQRKKHRVWRERKACYGQMIQLDGSKHAWLEDRGPKIVLMSYIDDATSQVYGRFYTHEGTIPAMDSFFRYIHLKGLPQSLYADRHDTYKSPKGLSLEEELVGKEESQSQFQRAIAELGITLIYAHSPQAKGRIERLFKTFQDRLIKEMRLEAISSLEEANTFLETYLPEHNQRFSCDAANPIDLHRAVPKTIDLRHILCRKQSRSLRKDGTISYQNQCYLIRASSRPKKVEVQEWLDGSLHLMENSTELSFTPIVKSVSVNPKPVGPIIRVHFKPSPSPDHPWKQDPFRKVRNTVSLP